MTRPAESMVAVGIGNTSVQIGYFSSLDASLPVPETHLVFPSRTVDWDCLRQAFPEPDQLKRSATPWFVASVYRDSFQRIADWVHRQCPFARLVNLTHERFPIGLCVKQPEKVGTDRIAAAVAVNQLRFRDHSAICVDAGTALTVNAISRRGEFLGGAILPGTTTAALALAKSTDQLPEIKVSAASLPAPIGKDTDEAIRSGIYWGAVGAVKELVLRFREHDELRTAELYVTGGFGPALARQLDGNPQLVSHLVLSGIAISAREWLKATE